MANRCDECTTLSVLGAKIALARARPRHYHATTVANGASLGVPNIPRQPGNPSPDPLTLRTRVCAPGAFFVKRCELIHHDLQCIIT